MRHGFSLRTMKKILILAAGVIAWSHSSTAWAVVGQAEEYDPFKARDIEEFHSGILEEEQSRQREESRASFEGDENLTAEGGLSRDAQELEKIKREILKIPKRDRLKFGLDGQHAFESNVKRLPPRQSKSDQIMDLGGFSEVDLGGRKTDLRIEGRGGRQWNIHFPESDFWLAEERVRYRRRYFKKVAHSLQSRIARQSQRTIELDQKKVRWDSHQNTAFNYTLSEKFSANLELNALKRLYTTEPFDQDSAWEASMAPSLFWSVTPKSRFSAGYIFGPSRIRTKVGDTNTHEVHAGYFGRVTRKSSLSFDASFSHQTARSLETPEINTVKVGAGYILQVTPKTQMMVQAIRSVQNTSSNAVPGADENAAVKTDSHFTNDNVILSLNSRVNRKLTGIVNVGMSQFRNQAPKGGDEDVEGRQWTFPVSLTANYALKRWIQLRIRYTYAFRTGNEKSDTYRAHTLTSGVNVVF